MGYVGNKSWVFGVPIPFCGHLLTSDGPEGLLLPSSETLYDLRYSYRL